MLLVRHGQIQANRDGVWHGSTDSALTWRGRRQARRTARHVHQTHPEICAIYSSPLDRCQQTASATAKLLDLPVETHPGLAEMSIGEWEGLSFAELRSSHQLFRNIVQDPNYAPPGGESLQSVADRVSDAMHSIDQAHRDEKVLIVSHGIAMAIALAVFMNDDPTRFVDYHFHNCSITELLLAPAQVTSLNQYAHLGIWL